MVLKSVAISATLLEKVCGKGELVEQVLAEVSPEPPHISDQQERPPRVLQGRIAVSNRGVWPGSDRELPHLDSRIVIGQPAPVHFRHRRVPLMLGGHGGQGVRRVAHNPIMHNCDTSVSNKGKGDTGHGSLVTGHYLDTCDAAHRRQHNTCVRGRQRRRRIVPECCAAFRGVSDRCATEVSRLLVTEVSHLRGSRRHLAITVPREARSSDAAGNATHPPP